MIILKDKNFVALTPPMGWNSWDCYGAGVNEKQLLKNAEYMCENLKQYGWQYIICDIQWYEPKAVGNEYNNFTELCMDEYSRLIPAENRFPSSKNGVGFRAIADKIHEMGLKFGIHIMRGIPRQAVHNNTKILGTDKTAREIAHHFSVCSWNTDMYGVDCRREGAEEYYNSIFSLYANWGVDFVKVDDIANTEFSPGNPYSAREEIELIRRAIDKAGRDMVLSLSPGPAQIETVDHLSKYANMWRMTGDFWDSWDKLKSMFNYANNWYKYVKPGCWPDCDMLPLGKLCVNAKYHGEKGRLSNFTKDEQITMMTLWSVFRSPLFFGGDMPYNDEFTLSLVTNNEVLKINQASSGAHPVIYNDNESVWLTKDSDGNAVIAIFNLSDVKKDFIYRLEDFNLNEKYTVRDLWRHKDLLNSVSKINTLIEPHGAVLYKLIKED